jgi:hypothetical protein
VRFCAPLFPIRALRWRGFADRRQASSPRPLRRCSPQPTRRGLPLQNLAQGTTTTQSVPLSQQVAGGAIGGLGLLANGAGIAQGGVGRGLAAAATAAEAERNRQAQQLNFLQTYKALTDGASRRRRRKPPSAIRA